MAEIGSLMGRIDAEFNAADEKIKKFQSEQVQEHHVRQDRLEQLDQLLEKLSDIWRPRLEALAQRFGDRVKTTPEVAKGRRHASFQFQSDLARIRLRFSVTANSDVTRVIFVYDLEILPVLTQFESHDELEFPIDSIDRGALTQWIDDRIVTFVRTYLSLHENEFYLKKAMVEDPVARVRFPKHAAGATLEWKGKSYYFVSDETRQEFEKQQGIASEAALSR
jgi:YHS domain-containing protein